MEVLKKAIASSRVQYLNGILNINVLDEFVNCRNSSSDTNTNDKRREENGETK